VSHPIPGSSRRGKPARVRGSLFVRTPLFSPEAGTGADSPFIYRENLAKDDPGEPITRLTLLERDRRPLLKLIRPTPDQHLTFKFNPSNCALDPTGTTLYGIQYEATNPDDPATMRARLWRWDTQANTLIAYGDTWPSAGLVLRQMALRGDGARGAAVTTRQNGDKV
jgi:hypothetical protein